MEPGYKFVTLLTLALLLIFQVQAQDAPADAPADAAAPAAAAAGTGKAGDGNAYFQDNPKILGLPDLLQPAQYTVSPKGPLPTGEAASVIMESMKKPWEGMEPPKFSPFNPYKEAEVMASESGAPDGWGVWRADPPGAPFIVQPPETKTTFLFDTKNIFNRGMIELKKSSKTVAEEYRKAPWHPLKTAQKDPLSWQWAQNPMPDYFPTVQQFYVNTKSETDINANPIPKYVRKMKQKWRIYTPQSKGPNTTPVYKSKPYHVMFESQTWNVPAVPKLQSIKHPEPATAGQSVFPFERPVNGDAPSSLLEQSATARSRSRSRSHSRRLRRFASYRASRNVAARRAQQRARAVDVARMSEGRLDWPALRVRSAAASASASASASTLTAIAGSMPMRFLRLSSRMQVPDADAAAPADAAAGAGASGAAAPPVVRGLNASDDVLSLSPVRRELTPEVYDPSRTLPLSEEQATKDSEATRWSFSAEKLIESRRSPYQRTKGKADDQDAKIATAPPKDGLTEDYARPHLLSRYMQADRPVQMSSYGMSLPVETFQHIKSDKLTKEMYPKWYVPAAAAQPPLSLPVVDGAAAPAADAPAADGSLLQVGETLLGGDAHTPASLNSERQPNSHSNSKAGVKADAKAKAKAEAEEEVEVELEDEDAPPRGFSLLEVAQASTSRSRSQSRQRSRVRLQARARGGLRHKARKFWWDDQAKVAENDRRRAHIKRRYGKDTLDAISSLKSSPSARRKARNFHRMLLQTGTQVRAEGGGNIVMDGAFAQQAAAGMADPADAGPGAPTDLMPVVPKGPGYGVPVGAAGIRIQVPAEGSGGGTNINDDPNSPNFFMKGLNEIQTRTDGMQPLGMGSSDPTEYQGPTAPPVKFNPTLQYTTVYSRDGTAYRIPMNQLSQANGRPVLGQGQQQGGNSQLPQQAYTQAWVGAGSLPQPPPLSVPPVPAPRPDPIPPNAMEIPGSYGPAGPAPLPAPPASFMGKGEGYKQVFGPLNPPAAGAQLKVNQNGYFMYANSFRNPDSGVAPNMPTGQVIVVAE